MQYKYERASTRTAFLIGTGHNGKFVQNMIWCGLRAIIIVQVGHQNQAASSGGKLDARGRMVDAPCLAN